MTDDSREPDSATSVRRGEADSAAGEADSATSVRRSPTHAERCRTLAAQARSATLCTIARDPAGYPYGSLVAVAVDGRGRPLLLLSNLAEHTRNLGERPEASILLTQVEIPSVQPLAHGRVTLMGPCRPIEDAERTEVRRIFLAHQPDAAAYVNFPDFTFYRLEPVTLRYVGGFGRMSWVDAQEYAAAEPDPLADSAAGILAHMNDDHADAVLAYARALASMPEASEATMTAVDHYGFDLAVATPAGSRMARVAFDRPVATPTEVRRAMVALAARARGSR